MKIILIAICFIVGSIIGLWGAHLINTRTSWGQKRIKKYLNRQKIKEEKL